MQDDDFDWEWSSLVAALPIHYHYDQSSASPAFKAGSTGGADCQSNTAASLLKKAASSPAADGSGSAATRAIETKTAPASPGMLASSRGPAQGSPGQKTAAPQKPPDGHHSHQHRSPSTAAQQPHDSGAQLLMRQLEHALHSPKSPRQLQSHAASTSHALHSATAVLKPRGPGARDALNLQGTSVPNASNDSSSRDDEDEVEAAIMQQMAAANALAVVLAESDAN